RSCPSSEKDRIGILSHDPSRSPNFPSRREKNGAKSGNGLQDWKDQRLESGWERVPTPSRIGESRGRPIAIHGRVVICVTRPTRQLVRSSPCVRCLSWSVF